MLVEKLVERVGGEAEALEQQAKMGWDESRRREKELRVEIERLREALEFYADERRYAYAHEQWVGELGLADAILDDCGEIARGALALRGADERQPQKQTCSDCYGKGLTDQDDRPGILLPADECPRCRGTGER